MVFIWIIFVYCAEQEKPKIVVGFKLLSPEDNKSLLREI